MHKAYEVDVDHRTRAKDHFSGVCSLEAKDLDGAEGLLRVLQGTPELAADVASLLRESRNMRALRVSLAESLAAAAESGSLKNVGDLRAMHDARILLIGYELGRLSAGRDSSKRAAVQQAKELIRQREVLVAAV